MPSLSRTIKVFLSSGLSGIYKSQEEKTKLGFCVKKIQLPVFCSCACCNYFTDDDDDDDDADE